MRRTLLLLASLAVLGAQTAGAEIALLANGQTLKLDGHRVEGEQMVLLLRGGGELGLSPTAVQGIVPDEVIDEVLGQATRGGGAGELRELAAAVARRHGLPPELVLAVVSVESAFQPRAVSPKGAQGLMQLMPGTARSLGVEDPFDPEQNLDGGVRHLGALLVRYDGDLPRALAAYNAGQGAVEKHGGIPPYRETRDYVRKVLDRYAPEDSRAAGTPATRQLRARKERAEPPPGEATTGDRTGGAAPKAGETP